MSAENFPTGSIVKFLANMFDEECGEDCAWLEPIWRILTKVPEKHIIRNAMGTSEFFDCINTNLDGDHYSELVKHMPADMDSFLNISAKKLREAIMANDIESWTLLFQRNGVEDLHALKYFLSIMFFIMGTEEEVQEKELFIRAFTLLTMLMLLWRKSLPSVCTEAAADDEPGPAIIRYNGEASLPEGYQAIQNLFIYAIDILEEDEKLIKLLTNYILYDISLIVRMPVCFTVGMHISLLCSTIVIQSAMPIGPDIHSCDVASTRTDLAFSWLYHMMLNTPPNLHETLSDNVGAALHIFVHLFNENDVISFTNFCNRHNVALFIIHMKEHIMYSQWFQKAFSRLGNHYGSFPEFSQILFKLPYDITYDIIKSMVRNKEHLCGACLMNLNLKAINGISEEELQEMQPFRNQLLHLVFRQLVNEHIDAKTVPSVLRVIYDLTRQAGAQFYADIINFESDEPVVKFLVRDALCLGNTVSYHMSLNWKHATTNQFIIKIWCRLLVISNIVEARHLKVIVPLIESSSVSDLHPCVDYMRVIFPYIVWGGENAAIVIRIVNTLIRHALSSGSKSLGYVRVLFKAVFYGNMAHTVRRVSYGIANCICNNKASFRLFQRFRALKLLTNHLVHNIMNIYITHQEPIAWKIIYCTLQAVEYTDIPQYLFNLLRFIIENQIFSSDFIVDTQLACFGSMLTIIKYRRARNLIDEGDIPFFRLLNTFLKKCFQTGDCGSQALFLFLDIIDEIRTFMPNTNQWVLADYEASEHAIMQYLSTENYYVSNTICYSVFSAVAKTYGDMTLRLKLISHVELVRLIRTRLRFYLLGEVSQCITFIRYRLHWSTLALLFGKICVQEPEFRAIYIETMHYILQNGQEPQKSLIIKSMYDICVIHNDNVAIMMPVLIDYIAYRSNLQIGACQSLLYLVDCSYIHLQRTEYLTLVSLIATEEIKLRDLFMKLFEENVLYNNTDLILPNFIPMILYLNKLSDLPYYSFNVKESEQMNLLPGFISNRLQVYETLLKYVTTCNKFQLMLNIATDIVDLLHHYRLPHTLESIKVLTDAIQIIYVIIKTIDNKYDIHNEVMLYDITFENINAMGWQPTYLFKNYNSIIKQVLEILLALYEDVQTIHPSVLEDLFHLIIFMVATFFENVSTLVLNAPNTPFARNIKALSVLYKRCGQFN